MALVAYRPGNSCSGDVLVREQLMAERRKDQERHYHKQIWTKKPHGGPYVKVRLLMIQSCSTRQWTQQMNAGCQQCDVKGGYDALIDGPDGQKLSTGLGYERPQRGPTTNFVGNHMTQVA